ncbi:cilia- and flagella-associated protein 95 isoform X2 [Dendropsophus ebraccatus]|uniref:cilia- and flagella-associated protein 95 isoform X2 n=1 Tax=Dendropsophus ebraccatus TaxID=150705 RepID=UPI003831C365
MAMYVMDGSHGRGMLETKGSLYLRSHHMHYEKPTKVSGWHQSREAEPKDYDVNEVPLGKKNLCHSTYRRFGNISNEDWNTTTEHQLSQVHLKGDYEVKDVRKQMVSEDNLATLNLKRQTGLPDSGFGAVLPHHSKDHNKIRIQKFQIMCLPTRDAIPNLRTQQTIEGMDETPGRMKVEYMPIGKSDKRCLNQPVLLHHIYDD